MKVANKVFKNINVAEDNTHYHRNVPLQNIIFIQFAKYEKVAKMINIKCAN